MDIAVIIPAAGIGRRFTKSTRSNPLSTAASKVEHNLAGQPVFLRAVELFVNHPSVAQVILAVHPKRIEAFNLRWGDKLAFHGVCVVPGGTVERWETVSKALDAVETSCTHVAVP